MSREKEINEMLKEFPLEVRREFLDKEYGVIKEVSVLSFDLIGLSNGLIMMVEMGTMFLSSVITLEMIYDVKSTPNGYVVTNKIDLFSRVDDWNEYMNGGKGKC